MPKINKNLLLTVIVGGVILAIIMNFAKQKAPGLSGKLFGGSTFEGDMVQESGYEDQTGM